MLCTNLQFCFVMECLSQALLYRYFGDQTAKLRPYGVRGALDAANLWCAAQHPSCPDIEAWFEAAASHLSLGKEDVKRTFGQLSQDPHTVFICEMWDAIAKASETLRRERVAKQKGPQSAIVASEPQAASGPGPMNRDVRMSDERTRPVATETLVSH